MFRKIFFSFFITMSSYGQFFYDDSGFQAAIISEESNHLLDDFCDACGCSANGGAMGFSSLLTQQFVGVRYMQQNYRSKEGIFNNSPWGKEQFNTMQVWARVPVSSKIQVSALVPYHFHTQEKESGSQSISGLGDITLMGLYSVYKTKKDSAVLNHHLQIGTGVKAPTGTYEGSNQGTVNPSFQVGTGSWDYLLVSEYVVQLKKWGLHTTLSYWVKTENDAKYQFGNQLNYSGSIFYTIEKNWGILVPQIGLAGEKYDSNKQFSLLVSKTSGSALFGRLGTEVAYEKWHLGLQYLHPLSQDLTGGFVEVQNRWSLNINFSF